MELAVPYLGSSWAALCEPLARQTVVIGPGGARSESAYDARGSRILSADPDGRSVYYGYDAAGREVSRTYGPGGESAYFAYDAAGNRAAVLDPRGNPVYFGYDATGRRDRITDAVGRSEYFAYDPAGNLEVEVSAAGMPTYYAYDALDRMTGRSSANDAPSYFSYDVLSRMRGATGERGTTYYAYTARSEVEARRLPGGTAVYHEYDAAGNRSRRGGRRCPEGGSPNAVRARSHAERNRTAVKVTGVGTSYYQHDPLGRITTLEPRSGIVRVIARGIGLFSIQPDHAAMQGLMRGTGCWWHLDCAK
jgi:YD repeat-containing protein